MLAVLKRGRDYGRDDFFHRHGYRVGVAFASETRLMNIYYIYLSARSQSMTGHVMTPFCRDLVAAADSQAQPEWLLL
jgi:hypothetical protein